jgi:hypothetical protein
LLGETQPVGLVSEHTPVDEQQAPEQGFGVQVVPKPWKLLPAVVQPAGLPVGAKVTVQVSVLEQQAPTRAVQGLGVQTVPTPRNELVAAQPRVVVVVQVPVLLQQAPRRGVQGLDGRQVLPSPWNELVPVHAVDSVTEHTPVPLQQAPVPGQSGTAPHTVPTPLNVLVAVGQPARVTVVQA